MLKDIWEKRFDGLQYTGARAPLYWSPFLSKNMFFVFFSDMNHGELKVPSPIGRPSRDTQNLVLSELSLIIPFQNIENKFLGLQYIGGDQVHWRSRFKLVRVVQVVSWSGDQVERVVRVPVVSLDDMLQKINGFHALNHQIIETS